jgi:hypothetical protein
VGSGVAVGGTGVSVGGTGVSVGGTGVAVGGTGVAVGNTGIGVAVGSGVFLPPQALRTAANANNTSGKTKRFIGGFSSPRYKRLIGDRVYMLINGISSMV